MCDFFCKFFKKFLAQKYKADIPPHIRLIIPYLFVYFVNDYASFSTVT